MFLLLSLCVCLSLLSTAIMSYIAIASEVAPWIAPVIAVTIMILLKQLIRYTWFNEYVVIAIAAGSIGGMIGLSLGLTWPSLYFLHQNFFETWMHEPFFFAMLITSMVLVAGFLAFLISQFLRYHFIVQQNLQFPISVLVHDFIYKKQTTYSIFGLLNGFVVSSSWNFFTLIARVPLHHYLYNLQIIPVFLSIGFIVGQSIAVPLLIGLLSKAIMLDGIYQHFFYFEKYESFILTFASGMLFAVIALTIISSFKDFSSEIDGSMRVYVKKLILKFGNNSYRLLLFIALLLSGCLLSYWGVTILQQLYIFLALFLLSQVVVSVVGLIGVLDLPNFVGFLVLPLTCFFHISTLSALIVVVFSTICLGLISDLLFSYKISYLADISHKKILSYQILGFIVAACSVGFIIWWYIKALHLGSDILLGRQALEQEAFFTSGNYNFHVLLIGFIFALFLSLFIKDMLIVATGFMMPISMSFWLILAGGLSYLVKNRTKFYSFCFGIYASHALWMFLRALLLRV